MENDRGTIFLVLLVFSLRFALSYLLYSVYLISVDTISLFFDKQPFRIYNADMVNKSNEDNNQEDLDITNEDNEIEEPDLEEIESNQTEIIKNLKAKLKVCEQEKRDILEESQRARADFLNARKRLEDERVRDRIRNKKSHVEELLPLCDSFQMAMSNKEAWEKADKAWRSGIEGIYSQLNQLLNSYDVKTINPLGEKFDPNRHEAIGVTEVEDENKVDEVVTVVQFGYEMTVDGESEVIRPARVTTGIIKG